MKNPQSRRDKVKDDRTKLAERAVKKRRREILRAENKRACEKIKAEKLERAREKRKNREKLYAKVCATLKNRASGFDYENHGLIPTVELKIDGDRTSALSYLVRSGITTYDIRSIGGKTLVKIQKKDLRKAVAILSEMCYTYKVVASFGIWRCLSFWAARSGLIVGACAFAVGLAAVYGRVWRIEITGNDRLPVAAVEGALKRAGVYVGCDRSIAIARSAVALSGLDGIADSSCELSGTTLTVNVLESEPSKPRTTYDSYVSRYDATVTRIVMRSGRALVECGANVARGETIASGDVLSTSGEFLYKTDCDGEIYGRVSISYSAHVPARVIEYRRTGESATVATYSLFGIKLGSLRSPYKTYELESATYKYDVLIPLYVTTYRYYETAAIEYERDIDEAARVFATAETERLELVGAFEYSYEVYNELPEMYKVHLFLTGELVISTGIRSS